MKIASLVLGVVPFTLFFAPACSAQEVSAGAGQDGPAAPKPEAKFDQTHALWTEVLAERMHGDGFDYAGLKKDRAKLDRYIAQLESVTPDAFVAWSKAERYAFWIDAYNAYTVKTVVDGYPVESIKDLGTEKQSVWDEPTIPLARLAPELDAKKLTLNDIENKILRPEFKDARVHAAINCASQGCPPLRAEAFRAKDLDKQLDDQVLRWLREEKRNRFDESKRRVQVSKVFDWFKDDFVRDAGSVQAWLARHDAERLGWMKSGKVEIGYLDYSWKLNDAK